MKMAAAHALAALAKEPVPYYVKAAYHNDNIEYGKEHIIPLPFNKEALIWVASAVARTAVEEGVARIDNYNDTDYKEHLRCLIYGCPENE
jgi:malate dehydrogenase (oxaloacetate-decarboxylating)(NADP+)